VFSFVLGASFVLSVAGPMTADVDRTTAIAAAAGRPRECAAPHRRGRKPTVWQRAKTPRLGPYCDLVAKATTLLDQDAHASLEAANAADAAWPGHAGARAVKGRALLALGKATDSLAAFDEALAIDPSSLEDPKTMRDHARALAATGKLDAAADVYRTLVPRASLLADRAKTTVLLEAAFAVMGAAETGPPAELAVHLTEVASYLAEARTDETAPERGDVLLASALLHDRLGESSKASTFLAEATKTGTVPRDPTTPYVANPADALALSALGEEARDPRGAATTWTEYLAASKGSPFDARARARLATLPKPVPGADATKPAAPKPKPPPAPKKAKPPPAPKRAKP